MEKDDRADYNASSQTESKSEPAELREKQTEAVVYERYRMPQTSTSSPISLEEVKNVPRATGQRDAEVFEVKQSVERPIPFEPTQQEKENETAYGTSKARRIYIRGNIISNERC